MALGYAAIITTLFLWSGFFLSLRGGAISALQPADIALTRFFIPALVLLPFVLKSMDKVRAVPNKYLIGIVIGSGLPYLLVAGTAMQAYGNQLSDVDMAAVITYERNAWGNDTGDNVSAKDIVDFKNQ